MEELVSRKYGKYEVKIHLAEDELAKVNIIMRAKSMKNYQAMIRKMIDYYWESHILINTNKGL